MNNSTNPETRKLLEKTEKELIIKTGFDAYFETEGDYLAKICGWFE